MASENFHNVLYKWVLHTGLHHCPRCHEMAGQIRTSAEWDVTERPALHIGCLCELKPCNGIGELITAPPYVAPGHHLATKGAKGEGPGKGSKGGDKGDGAGKGSKGGDKGDDAGKGSKATNPDNTDGTNTEKPNAPKADDLTPDAPPGTPAATLPNRWQ